MAKILITMLCFAIRGYGISSNCFWWFLTCSTILLCFFLHSTLGWLDVNIMFPLCILQVELCRRANIPRVKTHNIPGSYTTEWENRAAVYTIITLDKSECISALPLWWSKCETDKVQMVWSTEATSLRFGFLILYEWRSTGLERPRRAASAA